MAKNVNNSNKKNKTNIGLVIALCIVSGLLILSTILWISSMRKNNSMGLAMEAVYQRNFYDLVDNVNNSEVKLSKVLAGTYDNYSRKLLGEVSKNTNSASYNLNNLPISLNGVDETKAFINKVSAYTGTLCDKLDKGNSLTTAEIDTLEEIYESMLILKDNLNKFNQDFMVEGYNIFKNGNLVDDYNDFTTNIQGIKGSDVEYPTMIYDGPFAESLSSKKVKGLSGELVSVEVAKQSIKKVYSYLNDEDIEYVTETTGMFNTFDFKVDTDQINLYIQVTKNGGKILTVSGYGQNNNFVNLSEAINKAKDVAKEQTGIVFDCVWSDVVGGNAYINLAPVENKVVIYPDLIKVKVNLSSGEIIGYSANNFYINHTNRNIGSASYSKEEANAKVPSGFNVEMSRLCIAPLEYGTEKLCYEFKALKNDVTYYIYINATDGTTENILRVVETTDGNKLM